MKIPSHLLAAVALSAPCLATWTNLTESDYTLSPTEPSSIIAALDSILPIRTVKQVLASANHANPDSSPNVNHLTTAFTWENVPGYNDKSGLKWFPQGITTSADASAEGTYDGDAVVLVSWHCDYYYLGKRGARVSFVNMNDGDGESRAYRNVLLVEPTVGDDAEPDFRAIEGLHAGGIAWFGDYLYVASTATGLRVFDMRHIYEVHEGGGIGRVGEGVYEAFEYDYVLPQVRQYNWVPKDGVDDFRWSYISLDRTSDPPTLIAGEYNTAAPNRLTHFPIDTTTGLLRTDSTGIAVSSSTVSHELTKIQGATMVSGKYFLTQSSGSVWSFTWMDGERQNKGVFASVPEDVSYQAGVGGGGGGGLWSLTEMPWDRHVVMLDLGGLA